MTEQTMEEHQAQMQGGAEKMEEGLREAGEGAVGAASDAWRSGTEQVRRGWKKSGEAMQDYSDKATGWIRENPMSGVLLAFGAGALLGMLLRGRE